MRLNILHAIHDFLPRHRAGSEIYAGDLCLALQARHHVTLLSAEYDPARRHGDVDWRLHDGLPVAEIVNNWLGEGFESTYRPALVGERLGQVLDVVQPDVLHVHNLLNLSFDLPALAKARGIPVVATLHDYTLLCPSGGQRVHRAERHVCRTIDPARCARCFPDSPFHAQMLLGGVAAGPGAGLVRRAARAARRRWPLAADRGARLVRRVARAAVSEHDISRRLDAARRVFEDVDVFVAPVPATAREYERFGVPPGKIRVADYGTAPLDLPPATPREAGALRIGFVGTLAWHKGAHVLLDAVRMLAPESYHLELHGDPGVFPDYTAALRRAAEGLPVTLAGGFDRRRTGAVFSGLDVLVVPSIWLENSPLVIHEAWLAGVPVVASRIGGIADLIEHGRNGLLYDPESPRELAVVLRRLAEDPDLLGALRVPNARSAVKSIEEDALAWEQIYAGLVTPPRG